MAHQIAVNGPGIEAASYSHGRTDEKRIDQRAGCKFPGTEDGDADEDLENTVEVLAPGFMFLEFPDRLAGGRLPALARLVNAADCHSDSPFEISGASSAHRRSYCA